MLEKNKNIVKAMLKQGKKVSGAWCQSGSPITTEILAEAGYDALMIDLEHGPGDIMATIHQIQAMKGEVAIPFCRAPWNDFVQIKRILDAGVYGLLVPYVNSKEETLAAVSAVSYPSDGIRGVAGSPRAAHYGNNSMDYLKSSNEEVFLMTAVETPEAVSHLDEILSVGRLDGIFIGPMDLATNMGYFGNPKADEVQKSIRVIEEKVISSGKSLATVAGTWEDAKEKYERGYSMVFFFSDTTTLSSVARERLRMFRESFS
ncbi:2,4-dihydroxyhept-2-ene-1,7-dioic acid aldolase [Marispirochaeta aestuarii]|uniref:2,4-dihydroxyhept-2-ene-1,7-dioic acid aldolase n=1 Tax=Marispirochaeta aestuarii TaxID=1963862 RepID=A0A1Y1RUI8_9SPIO|nr:aldolase/citrate lyase family protein [Marispirochaeta aestuarii]ORC32715.1 2,4-dihydroxyhept-2-ene-1,7-dioic acid aldolase [Marispirochaeta aestuarii]